MFGLERVERLGIDGVEVAGVDEGGVDAFGGEDIGYVFALVSLYDITLVV